MDVSRKRHFQKHLEPARPLRRCTPVDVQAMKTGLEQTPVMDCKITPEQFFRIINLNKPAGKTSAVLGGLEPSAVFVCCRAPLLQPGFPHEPGQLCRSQAEAALLAPTPGCAQPGQRGAVRSSHGPQLQIQLPI
ncbi:uncharacterized protein C8orf88 homolog isoform 1-T6 [Synchiropus picturatus]